MLQPKKTKYRRVQKGRSTGNAHRGHELAFGSFGIKALEECWVTARQIEVTKKPADVRMGKGKGDPECFAAVVTPGRILIEAEGVPFEIAKEALRLGAQKLPIKTKFIVRNDFVESTI